jgi:hypothetical protein
VGSLAVLTQWIGSQFIALQASVMNLVSTQLLDLSKTQLSTVEQYQVIGHYNKELRTGVLSLIASLIPGVRGTKMVALVTQESGQRFTEEEIAKIKKNPVEYLNLVSKICNEFKETRKQPTSC